MREVKEVGAVEGARSLPRTDGGYLDTVIALGIKCPQVRYEASARISGLGDHVEVEVGKLEC